jgi:hypothetical protein
VRGIGNDIIVNTSMREVVQMKKDEISRFIQDELRRRAMTTIDAVEAAEWLDAAGVLRDHKRGLPLRKRLRVREIVGGRQDPDKKYGNWFIDRV